MQVGKQINNRRAIIDFTIYFSIYICIRDSVLILRLMLVNINHYCFNILSKSEYI